MLEPLYTSAEMKAAEEGHDVAVLMARAGRAVAEEALRRYPEARSFSALCGKGANGGDARIALELLREAGRQAEEGVGGEVIIDGLFGTGFQGEPRPEAAAQIDAVNAAGVPVIAVDLPSGVNADSGAVAGPAVEADVTVAMHGHKVGNVVAPGRFLSGDVVVADIGLAPWETRHHLAGREILSIVPRKQPRDNKYTAGHVVVVGGSPGMTGAASLAANAALRADCGYVTVCCPEESRPVLETLVVEAVKRPLEEVFEAVERADALAIGPGLGRSVEARGLVRRLVEETDVPAVVDADALYELEPFERRATTVLTPHAGELARLLGEGSDSVSASRLEAVEQGVERFGCVCVLKGTDTLVAAPGEGVLVAAHGPPALATAGTGDVLTGVTAAFLAKGLDGRLAAAAAATACGVAAWLGPARGLVAGDVVGALPEVLDAEV
ncbi:MAG: NAD(P)H-hydrate dehydratase [Candidatus Rokuibacteriota bacterium]|nr:MAG: NAD(P)H-hydrate dehydratase [Candidatus Rokubacteria bacterium]